MIFHFLSFERSKKERRTRTSGSLKVSNYDILDHWGKDFENKIFSISKKFGLWKPEPKKQKYQIR